MKPKIKKLFGLLTLLTAFIVCGPYIPTKANIAVTMNPVRVDGSEAYNTVDCVSNYLSLSGYSSVSYTVRHYYDPAADHNKHPWASVDDYCRGGTFKVALQDSSGNKIDLDTSHWDRTDNNSLMYKQTVVDAKAIPSGWSNRTARIVITMYCGCYNTSKENYMIIDNVTMVGTAHTHSYTITNIKASNIVEIFKAFRSVYI